MMEKMLIALLAHMGITPAVFGDAMRQAMGTLAELHADKEAFKGGATAAVGHFNTRLDAIERQLGRIEAFLAYHFPPIPIEGESDNVVSLPERHTA